MSQEILNPDSAPKPYSETESSSQQIGKVAEAVATYAVRSTPKPRAAVRTIAGLAADDEVWAFVKANNLLPHLETAISLAQKAFLKLKEILYQLRRRRNEADYKMSSSDFVDHLACEFDLANAKIIVNEIERFSQEPLRAQLKNGILDYHRKSGLNS
jgi:hypothetical protein